jgi:hypothetical protein
MYIYLEIVLISFYDGCYTEGLISPFRSMSARDLRRFSAAASESGVICSSPPYQASRPAVSLEANLERNQFLF